MIGHAGKAPVLFLMGPTASGKTQLAMQLVQRFPCEIISVDSTMVYRGMDIGSAKPSAQELRQAPHRLIDIRDPQDIYSAGAFCADAFNAIAEIQQQDKIPLLVGGTMLYFRALEFGLAKMPSADAATKQRLQQEIDHLGSAALHQRLAEIDPPSAQRIHPNDPQRIARALEVYELSGQALSDYHRAQSKQILAFQPIKIGLMCEQRQQLHQRIEARFLQMMGAGFLDEVAKLYVRPELHVALPSMRSVGYRQLWQHLAGELDYEAAVGKGIICTRQLAKRQLTWLRSWPRLNLLEAMSATLMDDVIELLKGTAMGTLAE